MKRLLLFFLFTSILFSATTPVSFWRPYKPNKWTYCLFHFDDTYKPEGNIDKSLKIKIYGNPELKSGKFKNALSLKEGDKIEILSEAIFNPVGHHCAGISVEAWVYIEKYPEKEGYIIYRPHKKNTTKGFKLGITNEGRIFFDVTNTKEKYNRTTRTQTSPGVVPLEKWIHIAATNHGYPVGKRRIFLNGKIVEERISAWGEGIVVYDDTYEKKPGPLYIGNSDKGDNQFYGKIDELRVQPDVFYFWEKPEQKFLDPERKNKLSDSEKIFFSDLKPIIYLNFEDEKKIGDLPENISIEIKGKKQFINGVYGKGIANWVSLKGKKIFNMKEGAIEGWFCAREWDNFNGFGIGILSAEKRGKNWPGFSVGIHNSGIISPTGNPVALLVKKIKFEKGERPWSYVFQFQKPVIPDRWTHFVLQWDRGYWEFYLNGKLIGAGKCNFLDALDMEFFNLGKYQKEGATGFDEVYIYNRPLSPEEVYNSYIRYVSPDKIVKLKKNDFTLKLLPGLSKLILNFKNYYGEEAEKINLKITRRGNTVLEREIENTNEKVIDIKNLKEGHYKISCEFLKNGREIEKCEKEFEIKKIKWLENNLGLGVIPEPWNPVEVKGKRVFVFLREYNFSNGIVSSVKSKGNEVLAAPVTLKGRINGTPFILGKPAKIRILKKSDEFAEVNQKFELKNIKFIVNQKVEFDGFSSVKLEIIPEKEVEIENLTLVFPVKKEIGECFHTARSIGAWFACRLPEKEGKIWSPLDGFYSRSGVWVKKENGKYVPNLKEKGKWMTVGSLIPYWYLGNENGGISWCADNDRGWVIKNDVPSVEVVREKGGNVVVKINFIPVKTVLEKKREINFGWMATPVKTPGKNWRRMPGWDAFFPYHGRSCPYSPWPDDDKLDFSVKVLKRLSKSYHIMPFIAYRASNDRNKWAEYFRYEWYPERNGEFYTIGYYWDSLFPESLLDFSLYKFKKWIEAADVIDGIYIDMIYPCLNFDTVRGTAYKLPDGRIQPGFNIMNMRNFVKRYKCLLYSMGRKFPHVITHMTHCNIPMVLSFTDIAYEGECNYFTRGNFEKMKNFDSMDFWVPDILRACDDVHAMGYRFQFLNPIRDRLPDPERDKKLRRAFEGILYLIDSKSPDIDGIEEAEFIPYYRNRSLVPGPSEDILISVWNMGEKWASVITNWSKEDKRVKIKIRNPLKRNGEIFDYEKKIKIPVSNSEFEINVPARDYGIIIQQQ